MRVPSWLGLSTVHSRAGGHGLVVPEPLLIEAPHRLH